MESDKLYIVCIEQKEITKDIHNNIMNSIKL